MNHDDLIDNSGGIYEVDKIEILVLAICEINRKDHRQTNDIYDRCFGYRDRGGHGSDLWISDTWQLVINTGRRLLLS